MVCNSDGNQILGIRGKGIGTNREIISTGEKVMTPLTHFPGKDTGMISAHTQGVKQESTVNSYLVMEIGIIPSKHRFQGLGRGWHFQWFQICLFVCIGVRTLVCRSTPGHEMAQ